MAAAVAFSSAAVSPAAGQAVSKGRGRSQEARDRALVEKSFPRRLLDKPSWWGSGDTPNMEIADRYEFIRADLNNTGRPDFIVAAYESPWGSEGSVRVLKASSGDLVAQSSLGDCLMGSPQEISVVDLDHSGHPGVLVELPDGHGGPTLDWIFRWDGSKLISLGPTRTIGLSVCPGLYGSQFVDLDGDGFLEAVSTLVHAAPDEPVTYEVYKLAGGAYKPSGAFEFFEWFPVDSEPLPPAYRVREFIASLPGSPYVLTIANGDGRDEPPVESAQVLLNGEAVTTPGQITKTARWFKIPVTVKANNTVEVHASGPKDSQLYVGIGPASLPSLRPAPAAKPQ